VTNVAGPKACWRDKQYRLTWKVSHVGQENDVTVWRLLLNHCLGDKRARAILPAFSWPETIPVHLILNVAWWRKRSLNDAALSGDSVPEGLDASLRYNRRRWWYLIAFANNRDHNRLNIMLATTLLVA